MLNEIYPDFFILDGDKRNKEHKLLVYSDKYAEGQLPNAALMLIRQYGKSKRLTAKEWKKEKRTFYVSWERDSQKIQSEPINYQIILNNIKNNNIFLPHLLRLPTLTEEFIDISTNYGLASHPITHNLEPQIKFVAWNRDGFLGENFPIKPILAREGFCIESFLDILIARVISKRDTLVNSSNKFYSFNWFFTLRDIVNDCISSIEIALHLMYNKAKFHPKPDWLFDEAKLGSKYGRRFKDKLKWVSHISGSSFNIESLKPSVFLLKEIRNHLNHFDPPSFCLTAEESPKILNAVLDISKIHIEMRNSLNLSISNNLINLYLQKPVLFNPELAYARRAPFNEKEEGYNSCRWPEEQE
ncbi:hypothetical protein [Pontibacter chinhatensis]|uniref:Uncharacterized protein n=1 Tax=Pontibacter chinhatensis TaxID=1436961 RepID=A0A1I2TFJ4_9BACT|nr:hypothetical protein [Pontibacter chinhatensis]SFG61306.1 hypothetical protein SAMN05421739_10323 [Pontibacter chinhatensis]